MNKLKRLAAERTHQLEQSKWLHAFLRESTDLEDWIEDQMQLANSEEYGSDYEHLLVGLDVFKIGLGLPVHLSLLKDSHNTFNQRHGMSVGLSVRLSIILYQTLTGSSFNSCSHFTDITSPWCGVGSKCRTWRNFARFWLYSGWGIHVSQTHLVQLVACSFTNIKYKDNKISIAFIHKSSRIEPCIIPSLFTELRIHSTNDCLKLPRVKFHLHKSDV